MVFLRRLTSQSDGREEILAGLIATSEIMGAAGEKIRVAPAHG
jgi:hypothetical protein